MGHVGHMGHLWRGMAMPFEAAVFLADLFGPMPRLYPEDLSEDLRFAYEERAAVKEFCGNVPRNEAERQAWVEVIAVRKKLRLGT